MSRSTRGNQSRDEPSRSSSREGNDNSRDDYYEPAYANKAQPTLSIGCRIVVEGGKYDGKYGIITKFTPQKAYLDLDDAEGTVLLDQTRLILVKSSGAPSTERTPQKTSKPTSKDDFGSSASSSSSRAVPVSPSVDYGTPLYRSPSADYDSPPSSPVPVREKYSARTLFDSEDTLPRTSRSDYNQQGEYRNPAKPSSEVGTKIDVFAKKIEVAREEEQTQPNADGKIFRKSYTIDEIRRIDLQYEENDPYTGEARQHLKGSKEEAQVDHIIEIQMIVLAWNQAKYHIKNVVTRGQEVIPIDIIKKVVNNPDINLNVTTQTMNSIKKLPITAWLSLYKSNTGSQDSPLPSLQDIVAKRYSERFKDGEFRRIESAMAKAFKGIKKELLSKDLSCREREIITAFVYELEDLIEKMQIR